MRFILIITLCAISFTASAQFWHRKPKAERFSLLSAAQTQTPVAITPIYTAAPNVYTLQLPRSIYSLELAEDGVMKNAKHNMRFREYSLASYNFSDLALLYLQQNRFSEAKWYLLQSNAISRQQNDTKHTLSNLLILADIKTIIGELALAKLDLQEAHDLAAAKGMQVDMAEIDKKIMYLQNNKVVAAKPAMHYAEAVELANSKIAIN